MSSIPIHDLVRRLETLDDRGALATASHAEVLAWDEVDPWVGALVERIGKADGRAGNLTVAELRAFLQRLGRAAGPDGLLDARELETVGEQWGSRLELGSAANTARVLVGAFEKQRPCGGTGLRTTQERQPPRPRPNGRQPPSRQPSSRRPAQRPPSQLRSPQGPAAPVAPAGPQTPTSADNPLAGTRYASYSEPLHRWDESFWQGQPTGPRRDGSGTLREDPVQLALRILKDRYPAGYDLVRRAQSDPGFADLARRVFREAIYDQRAQQRGWRTQLTYREHADNLSTLVHESGHIVANRFGDYRQNGFDWGGDNQHPMPQLRNNVPMKAIGEERRSRRPGESRYAWLEPEDETLFQSKVNNYLSDPANPGRAIGTLSIARLLEETSQYETGLLAAYSVADRTLGDFASNDRTGLMTMMRYMATYLGYVRQNNPAMYQELTQSPQWSDLILTTWARGEHALELTRRQNTVNLRGRKLDEGDYRKHRRAGYSTPPRLPEQIQRQQRYMNEIRAFARTAAVAR